jgi:hypothetical protein
VKNPNWDMDPYIYTAWLPPEPSSVKLARLMVRAALWDWQIDHLADTAQLIMSELVSNAIKFGNGAEALVCPGGGLGTETLVIEVTDDNPEPPTIIDADSDDENHRGMFLVDALSSKWGVDLLECGKIVWARLEYGETAA